MQDDYATEFPWLKAHGLFVSDIKGDGNCLFNALSDQLYGHEGEHAKIRARVIDHLRQHEERYKHYLDVHPGGGQRRNPKRKNAGAFSSPSNLTQPTPAEIDEAWEKHLTRMAQGGTWGDNMEIQAFAEAFQTDVKIYDFDKVIVINAPGVKDIRPAVHIAYHTWEHYSSIRNIDGPFTGLPQVKDYSATPRLIAKQEEAVQKASMTQEWMVNNVMSSLPYLADRTSIKNTLVQCKGDVNKAVNILLGEEDTASVSSQQGSLSSERDNSDDEDFAAPNKKQDRKTKQSIKPLRKKRSTTVLKQEGATPLKEDSDSTSSISGPRVTRSSKRAAAARTGQLTPPDSDAELSKVANAVALLDRTSTDQIAQTASGKSDIKLPLRQTSALVDSAQAINSNTTKPSRREITQQKKILQKANKKIREQEKKKQLLRPSTPSTLNSSLEDLNNYVRTVYI